MKDYNKSSQIVNIKRFSVFVLFYWSIVALINFELLRWTSARTGPAPEPKSCWFWEQVKSEIFLSDSFLNSTG